MAELFCERDNPRARPVWSESHGHVVRKHTVRASRNPHSVKQFRAELEALQDTDGRIEIKKSLDSTSLVPQPIVSSTRRFIKPNQIPFIVASADARSQKKIWSKRKIVRDRMDPHDVLDDETYDHGEESDDSSLCSRIPLIKSEVDDDLALALLESTKFHLIETLQDMGFSTERASQAVYQAGALTIEDALVFLDPSTAAITEIGSVNFDVDRHDGTDTRELDSDTESWDLCSNNSLKL
jgi:hypothetical protein